jgi:alanine racemase
MPGRPWQVRQTALEIDLGLLKENFRVLAKRAPQAEVLALLKSDAYGHSHAEVSQALESLAPSDRLHGYGVANVEEGIELRRCGVKRPIYVLSGVQYFTEELYRCLATCDLTPVVSSLEVLRQLAETLRKNKCVCKVHLKLNSGMNRLGIDPSEMDSCLSLLKENPAIQVAGIMSHFAAAEKPRAAGTRRQVRVFQEMLARLRAEGIRPHYLHMSNSAGVASHLFPEGNLVRVGLHLYGLDDAALKPVARWTAQVYQLRELRKGDGVGYGPHFRAKKKMRMAVLGVGYGDGYRRSFSNKAEVLLRGKRCRVIGAVSMDLTAVDVTGLSAITTNDRAVLLGRDGREQITAGELAGHAKSISWEILTGISPRVPRVFLNG